MALVAVEAEVLNLCLLSTPVRNSMIDTLPTVRRCLFHLILFRNLAATLEAHSRNTHPDRATNILHSHRPLRRCYRDVD